MCALLLGCASGAGSPVAEPAPEDVGPQDVASSAPVDADSSDVESDTRPASRFGAVSGACGTLSEAVIAPGAAFLTNEYAFDGPFDPALLAGRRKARFEADNAGGSSKCSEIMSMQLLVDCAEATIAALEVEVQYDMEGAITDYVADFDGVRIGVSVTRAYLGPAHRDYSVDQATTLLTKKLGGVNESTANVSAADAWTRQVLHVWTLQPSWVPLLEEAWTSLDDALKADTVVLVTVESNSDAIVTDACD